MPAALTYLQDDPFRSHASALRRYGRLAKDLAPFSEFAVADLLRRNVPRDALVRGFDRAVEKALAHLAPAGASNGLSGL
jgi:hypothetical protein